MPWHWLQNITQFRSVSALSITYDNWLIPQLIVCTAMFKLTPQYLVSHDQLAFNKFSSPQQVMAYEEPTLSTDCQIVNPVFDYVPPELVTVFVSNMWVIFKINVLTLCVWLNVFQWWKLPFICLSAVNRVISQRRLLKITHMILSSIIGLQFYDFTSFSFYIY